MIYDISQPLSQETKVWPKDQPLVRHMGLSFAAGDDMDASALTMTAHLGTHVDAPGHFLRDGLSIDQVDLAVYLGPCRVLRRAKRPGELLQPSDLPESLGAPRVLFATESYDAEAGPSAGYAALAPDLVDELSRRKVILVGLDTPSVDLFEATGIPSHHACGRQGIAILEGAVLKHVPDGVYELIALPLKMVGLDGSPVRAVLRAI